jgi:hypothetical protein
VAHFSSMIDGQPARRPLTLVAHHGSSDSLMSRPKVASLFKPLIQMVTAKLGVDEKMTK